MQPIHMTFDLSKEPHEHDVVNIRQGELNAVVIEAEILDGETEVDLSPYDVYFECRHADGKMHQDNDSLTVSGNVITYTVHEKVGAVPGRIKTAYFSLVIATENGTRDLYATTENFEVRVLPNACQEDAGIAEAYSSEIEQMLQYCYDTFTANEADRQRTFDTNEADRFARTQEAIDAANDATDRANEAADMVHDAVEGELAPMFDSYLDTKKDVEGGFPAWETYLEGIYNAGTPDDETIGKNEDNELYLKTPVIYSSPFRPLDDFNVQTGAFTNAGAGWNTFVFPESFDGVPMVTCEAEGYTVEVKGVTAESFMYRLIAGASSSLDVTTGSYYVHTSKATSTSSMSQVSLVTGVALAGSSSTTADAVEIKYMAIEYGGDE